MKVNTTTEMQPIERMKTQGLTDKKKGVFMIAIASYTDLLTHEVAKKQWRVSSLAMGNIDSRIRNDWKTVQHELKAYFGDVEVRVTCGNSLVADGRITANVFSGRGALNLTFYKQPNNLAA